MNVFPDEARVEGRPLQVEIYSRWALEDEAHLQNAVVHPEYSAYSNYGEAAVASSLDYILFLPIRRQFSDFLNFAKKRKRNRFCRLEFRYWQSARASGKTNFETEIHKGNVLDKKQL